MQFLDRSHVHCSIANLFRHVIFPAGVFYQDDCTSYAETGHCALVVGYGTDDDGQDYWLVKNSMGSEHYGEDGYIRMARNKDNMCGIASYAYYPII